MKEHSVKSTKKRVAFFMTYFYRGGGTRVFIELANEFAEEGIDVDFLVLRDEGSFQQVLSPHVRIVSLDAKRMLYSIPSVIRYLRRDLPDALVATNKHTHLLALFCATLSRVPTRVILRVGMPYKLYFYKLRANWREILLPLLIKLFYRFAYGHVAVSEGVKDEYVEMTGVAPDRVKVIYNPLPKRDQVKQLREDSATLAFLRREKRRTIVTLGRLQEQKDHKTLIDAFAAIPEAYRLQLLILGQGGLKGHLEEYAKEKGVAEHVFIPGSFVHNPIELFRQADLFVLSSKFEGFPSVLIEAMVAGLPVISTDCAYGPREIIAPKTDYKKHIEHGVVYEDFGILTPVGDPQALRDAILALSSDPTVHAQYAKQAHIRSQDFDTKVLVGEYRRILLE